MAHCCDCRAGPSEPSMATVCGGASIYTFMTIVQTMLKSTCDIDDPCGRLTDTKILRPFYDFIVIGGGTAGSVVASRLTEVHQWNLLLLEAGGEEPLGLQVPSTVGRYEGTSVDWKYESEPSEEVCSGKKCSWPRGKVVGGTSTISDMIYTRGHASDYDEWEALGNPGWTFDDVLPYFKKSEDNRQMEFVDPEYHTEGGYMTVQQFNYQPHISADLVAAGEELGYLVTDVNGRNQTGTVVAQMYTKNGLRVSAAKGFLRPIKNRKNFHVILNAKATKLIINPVTNQVYGVEYVKNGVIRSAHVTREVIVCGGTVNSPQLLLLSGIGPREDLEKLGIPALQNLQVGYNLHDHAGYSLCFLINEPPLNELNQNSLISFLENRTGPVSGNGITQVTAFIRTKYADPETEAPDVQYYFHGYRSGCSRTGNSSERESSSVATRRNICITSSILHPKSRGVLKLRSANHLEYPSIMPRYLTDKFDVQVLVEAIQFALKFSYTEALRKYNMTLIDHPIKPCAHLKYPNNNYWKCAVKYSDKTPQHHQVGTCRMGPQWSKDSVVNAQLKVHGIKGLRVADASIMPTVTSGDTIAPVIMIGEKAADYIKYEWLPHTCDANRIAKNSYYKR